MNRRLIALMCLPACMATVATADTLPSNSCPAPETTSSGVNDGINTGKLTTSGPATALSELGVHWYRTGMSWNQIETGNGSFDWTATDSQIKSRSSGSTNILAILNGPVPGWEDPDFSKSSVQSDWAGFVTAAVQRYSGTTPDPNAPGQYLPRIAAWEIWNEPNATNGNFSGSLSQYHDYILKPAVDAIRASTNASAFVVAPALATNQYFVSGNDSASMTNMQNHLNEALGTNAAGNLVHVDAVSIHAYLAPSHIITMGAGARTWEQSQSLGWPLWLTEYGKNSDQCTGSGPCEAGETDQVCTFRDYQNRNLNLTPTFDVSFWFNFIDQDGTTLSGGNKQFGALGINNNCKTSPATSNYYSKWLFSDMQRQFGVSPIVAHDQSFSCN